VTCIKRGENIIKPLHTPIKAQGAIAILKGNLAPEGAVVKHSAISPRLMQVTLIFMAILIEAVEL